MNTLALTYRGRRLHYEGNLDLLHRPKVAVVGARACTPYGSHVATTLANTLAGQGVVTVSGGAFGIDAAAHRGAMSSVTGEADTIVVLACGLDRAYPSAHRDLFENILANGGLLVSEYEPGTPVSRTTFLARNQVIVDLSSATVVVEATSRSGSLHCARATHRTQGHALYAVPGPVTSVASEGTNRLIADGMAQALVDPTDVHPILNQIGASHS